MRNGLEMDEVDETWMRNGLEMDEKWMKNG
jgi:hypothetical protein